MAIEQQTQQFMYLEECSFFVVCVSLSRTIKELKNGSIMLYGNYCTGGVDWSII